MDFDNWTVLCACLCVCVRESVYVGVALFFSAVGRF